MGFFEKRLPLPATQAQDRGKAATAAGIEIVGMGKRFGSVTALDDVSLHIKPGEFHALLGENGAGKSTLVKCLIGFYTPDSGQIVINGRETVIATPKDADAVKIGMVYQHFTLIPSMSVAENVVLARCDLPRVIDWQTEKETIRRFVDSMPFKMDLNARVSSLSAGEKQKVEILKQLYLERRFLILDEPTSVLTPSEADDILGMLKQLCARKELTVLLITHKFREVKKFADAVSVLRKGRYIGTRMVDGVGEDTLATMMIGAAPEIPVLTRESNSIPGPARLRVEGLTVNNDEGVAAVRTVDLCVHPGEIVGIAGVSGNGQRELVEALLGQRPVDRGRVRMNEEPYGGSREEMRRHRLYSLPEEPLKNACVPGMSVSDNVSLRNFDLSPFASGIWMRRKRRQGQADAYIKNFNVKCDGSQARIDTLSGGNVQRAILARELSHPVDVLIVANPVFGLDFAAVAEIHGRIMAARNNGAAVLLISEDLDELLILADRIDVMSEGKVVFSAQRADFDVQQIGRYMAGGVMRVEACDPSGPNRNK